MNNSTFGKNLKSERRRLGYSQSDFARIGGVTKSTQTSYERGKTSPEASYLAAVAGVGADVLLLVTGDTSEKMLSAEEIALLRSFRGLDRQARARALTLIEGMAFAAGQGCGYISSMT